MYLRFMLHWIDFDENYLTFMESIFWEKLKHYNTQMLIYSGRPNHLYKCLFTAVQAVQQFGRLGTSEGARLETRTVTCTSEKDPSTISQGRIIWQNFENFTTAKMGPPCLEPRRNYRGT